MTFTVREMALRFACGLVLLICASAMVAAGPCPKECRSFVTLGNLNGVSSIGPGAELKWTATATKETCVLNVACELSVFGRTVDSFLVNSSTPMHLIDYTYGKIFGSGWVTLDTGCDANTSGVPQLRVDFQAQADGSYGGMNGSVVISAATCPMRTTCSRSEALNYVDGVH